MAIQARVRARFVEISHEFVPAGNRTNLISTVNAVTRTNQWQYDTLYVYTLTAKSGDVGTHPDGPFVMGIPQYQLIKTITYPDVTLTRTLKKGSEQ